MDHKIVPIIPRCFTTRGPVGLIRADPAPNWGEGVMGGGAGRGEGLREIGQPALPLIGDGGGGGEGGADQGRSARQNNQLFWSFQAFWLFRSLLPSGCLAFIFIDIIAPCYVC